MTNKERLKRLERCSLYGNYREREEDFREIEKALEVLEILKKYVYFSYKSRYIKMRDIHKQFISCDYEKVREWLENDQSIQ